MRLVIPTRAPARRSLIVLAALVLLAAIAGGALGTFLRFDLPDVRALEDYRPPLMTRVAAADGAVLDTFAEQRRILIDYDEIPTVFRDALVASEDASFFKHTGLDFKGILRAAWSDLRSWRLAQGASTLTQQLARNLFLHPEKTPRRKLQEALLAIEIERQYTKDEILRFYCNQVYMGHGRYGLEAASRFYFGLPARELSLSQAATLAGLLQRPEALSPKRHPERALERRNHVLRRMVENGSLDAEQAAAAQALPLDETAARDDRGDLAPYFVEEVRRWLQARFGSSDLYTGGLTVRTTLDPRLQEVANQALAFGLRELDRRRGWRGVAGRVPAGIDPAQWEAPGWSRGLTVDHVYEAVVLESGAHTARVRVGPYTGQLGAEAIAWTGASSPAKLLHAGDVVLVRLLELGAGQGVARVELEQEPEIEGALIAIDPATGAVRALIGGHDFGRSEYDRAIQASRQTGSAFKPFVYAAALAAGRTLADPVLDEPTVFLDPGNPVPYQPENYSEHYYGTITLRTALERSANISTVKLLQEVGYERVIELARRLGITTPLRPFPSLALGAFETKLIELTAAYGAFANQGVLVEPHLVDEVIAADGSTAERIEPKLTDAVTPEVAYLMNRLLAGVITDGTGRAAAELHQNLAGKTGTTDDNTDAWFVGYGPGLAVGVWIGFDEPRSLGRNETGAVAALPIWQYFMERAFAGEILPPFPMPPGVSLVPIDRRTGLRVDPRAYCQPVITEAFITGTEPTATCSVSAHQRLRLPHSFQRYPLDERGSLVLDPADLDRLLAGEPEARLLASDKRLEVRLPTEVVTLPVRIGEASPLDPAAGRLAAFDTSAWVGRDGREARVVWFGPAPHP